MARPTIASHQRHRLKNLAINKMIQLLIIFSVIGLFNHSTPANVTKNYDDYILYKIDTSRSEILWKCHHNGSLKILEGDLTFSKNKLVDAEITVDMNSIKNADIDNDLLQGTLENVLRSIEFFQTVNYPQARFKLHSATEKSNSDYKISGDFIIFNTDMCTTFDANISFSNDSLCITTSPIVLNRTNWGIYYLSKNNKFPKEEEAGFVVSDSVFIEADIRAYRVTE